MKRPGVFFDRDNTLIVNDGDLGDPAGVILVDGAADAVARARQYGFVVVTVSNQGGVARGLFDEDAVRTVNARLDELLRQANPAAIIERHEFCPYHPEGTVEKYRRESELRKPKPGMILAAAEEMGLDLSRSWLIGDQLRDIVAGHSAGCRTILFKDPALKPAIAREIQTDTQPDFRTITLRESIDIVAREAFRQYGPAAAAEPSVSQKEAPMTTPVQPPPNSLPLTASPARESPTPAGQAPACPPNQDRGPASADPRSMTRLEGLVQQVLDELRRRREEPPADFSVSKLLAGIVQILALAVLFVAYLSREAPALHTYLLFAIMLQTLTVALLIMGRQR